MLDTVRVTLSQGTVLGVECWPGGTTETTGSSLRSGLTDVETTYDIVGANKETLKQSIQFFSGSAIHEDV